MIHQPASSFYEAQAGEFVLEAEELLKMRETITRVYVQRTGKPLWVILEDMERDVFMSAVEAQKKTRKKKRITEKLKTEDKNSFIRIKFSRSSFKTYSNYHPTEIESFSFGSSG
ncbi:ATP-dependent Clp protease [Vigna unguiculata]|uniref:ATP-dependent Clp protease n=1 Tax=Vigna unguiculata TaxID=3917 RepID=A0A4D6NNR5_VIGUN|nr:ATP-dependent Clp protease [Vigna unguiculata]